MSQNNNNSRANLATPPEQSVKVNHEIATGLITILKEVS